MKHKKKKEVKSIPDKQCRIEPVKGNYSWSLLLFILLFYQSVLHATVILPIDGALDSKEILRTSQSTHKVTGNITGSGGETLPGVSIVVKGTTQSAISDVNGNYSLSTISPKATLVFSYLGMTAQEIAVNGKSLIDIVMQDDVVNLGEVVAIGYSTMKKKDITGSVSSLNAAQITRIPGNSIVGSLVGVPGIRVNAAGEIRIRGNRSVHAPNDPLIILDGMPYYENIVTIDPSDVESIDVLKDASSAALYGSQGANGVIIVTTKKGKEGKTSINYDAFAGWGVTNYHNFKAMNAEEYVAFKREAYRASGTWKDENDDSKIFLGNEIENRGKLDEDWVGKYLDKNRFWTSQTLTIASGAAKTQYKVSFNFKDEQARYKNCYNKKYFLTTDLDHQVTNFLKVGVSSRLYYYVGKNKPDPFGRLLTMSPLTPIHNEDGSLNVYPTGDPYVKNPYLNEDDDFYNDKSEEWKAFIKSYLLFNIADGLTLKTNFSYNPSFYARGYYYDNRSSTYNDAYNVAGVENNRRSDMVMNAILNYKKRLGDHDIDVFGVYEVQDLSYIRTGGSGGDQDLPSYMWYNMGSLKESKQLSSSFERSQLLSYVGRFQYGFKDKYLATITVREDGASQLSKDNRWDFFPSFALGWRISEENFMKNISYLSNLKLRVSYGITGNHSLAPYQTLGTLYGSFLTFRTDNGEVHYRGLEPSIRPTPDLKWEKTAMVNIGLDYAFLKGRISGALDYYDSKTNDLLNQRKLPYTSGFNFAWENIGKTQNKGFEASLNTVPIESKDFRLGVNLSFYMNKEKLIELYDPKLTKDIQNGWWLGYPVNGVYFDQKQLGIWQEDETDVAAIYGQKPGEVKVRDLDGNGKIDGSDRVILGTERPDWTGALQLTADWHDFDFSMDCYSEVGALVYDNYSTSNWTSELGRWNTVLVDYWTPEKPNNRHPRPITGQGIKYMSATGYYKNDFFAIRNITLGYKLPKSILKNTFQKVRFYVTVNDPYKYWKYERDGGLTFNESFYLLGANIQF